MKIRQLWPWRIGLLTVAIGALAFLAPNASAVVVHLGGGRTLSITPRQQTRPAAVRGSLAAQHAASTFSSNGNLDYNGGPVLHSSAPYLIFWVPGGESIAPSSKTLLERYFTDAAADSGKADDVFGVDRQYTDTNGLADYQQTFNSASQALVDKNPYPNLDPVNCPDTTTSYPTCITDAQLQTEITNFIAAKGLPTDGPSSESELPQNAPIYFVVLPADVNVCADSADCADNSFCAYHSPMGDGGDNVLYSPIPLLDTVQDPKGCQFDGNGAVQEPNGDPADVAIKYMSHEDNETITDPLVNAWFDNSSGNEDGDNCNFAGSFDPSGGSNPDAFQPTIGGDAGAGTLYNQLINGHEYYTQSEWSNGDVNCELQPNPGTVAPTFTVPPPGSNPRGQSVTFDPGASGAESSNPISSASWSFGDGSSETFNAQGSALAPVSHTYGALGRYTVTLTLVDDRGNLQSASEQVVVGSPPSASFKFAPGKPLAGAGVNFAGVASDSDNGVSLTSYSWNFGDGSSARGPSANHTYTRPGTYIATFAVTNSIGATTIVQKSVVVVPIRITKVTLRPKRNPRYILVQVNGPGTLTFGGRHFHASRAKTIKVTIPLSRGQRLQLQRASNVKLKLKLTFQPRFGPRVAKAVKVTLH